MLILASSSPRRRALLTTLGIPFEVIPSDLDERAPFAGEDPATYALHLAREKAAEVAVRHPDDMIVGADTVVAVEDQILGKPQDAPDALRMLRLLRGREHSVTTAVVVVSRGESRSGTVTSRVRMCSFSDEEAEAYVATGEPMDKAGAYAVQGLGGTLVEAVDGCYNAVVGFPLCLVVDLLREAGVPVSLPADSSCRRHEAPAASVV